MLEVGLTGGELAAILLRETVELTDGPAGILLRVAVELTMGIPRVAVGLVV